MLNSGFFALQAGSPVWNKWGAELARLYAMEITGDPYALNFAEQFGLNHIIHRDKSFVPLDPLFNYACGGSAVLRDQRGKVAVGFPPFTPVKCAHLLDFPRYGRMYLDRKLLYKGGDYLTDAERAALEARVRA